MRHERSHIPDMESNSHTLHWKGKSSPMDHQGSNLTPTVSEGGRALFGLVIYTAMGWGEEVGGDLTHVNLRVFS